MSHNATPSHKLTEKMTSIAGIIRAMQFKSCGGSIKRVLALLGDAKIMPAYESASGRGMTRLYLSADVQPVIDAHVKAELDKIKPASQVPLFPSPTTTTTGLEAQVKILTSAVWKLKDSITDAEVDITAKVTEQNRLVLLAVKANSDAIALLCKELGVKLPA